MGLDATVMCNCIRDGLKIPEEFENVFVMDEDGYPSLTLGYEGNEDIYQKFDGWVENSCSHEDMDKACERISNWYGVRVFQNTLSKLNRNNRFDTLLREIPDANGGITTSIAAKKMIEELKTFEVIDAFGKKHVLIDEESGEEIWEYIPQYGGKMILSGSEGINLGIDESGFFIVSDQGQELFRSNKFKQNLNNRGVTERHGSAEVEYVDLSNSYSFTCHSAISGKQIQWEDGSWENSKGQVRFEYPETFYTDVRDREPEEFKYIIEPLKIICEAAIETNNPIR
ncbi:MAG: hypothetical protein ACRBHB_02380 [Arenicella sp.]